VVEVVVIVVSMPETLRSVTLDGNPFSPRIGWAWTHYRRAVVTA
jgi:hypothetical protein